MVRGVPPVRLASASIGVLAHVQVVVEAQARGQQGGLAVLAQIVEVVDGTPEFFRGDVQILDELEDIVHDAVNDGFYPLVAAGLVQTGYFFQQCCDFLSVHGLD
jgi:hypothetical protein